MVSFLIKLAIALYVFMNFKKMILYEDDNTQIEYNFEDLKNEPILAMANSGYKMFHIVRKQATAKMMYWDDPEVHLNVDMHFIQKSYHWYKYTDPSYLKIEEIAAK